MKSLGGTVPKLLSPCLAFVLTFAPPGWSAQQTPGATVAVALLSEPPGALVFVNGEARGAAPVELRNLPPGTHRIRFEKPGYLEHARLLQLAAGERARLRVALTPLTRTVYPVSQVESAPPAGGGGSKLKWIVPLALAGGVGAFLLLRESNSPPVAGTVTVTPAQGIVSVTRLAHSASGASDPDGDALTYTWNFGDGGTGSGQAVTHVYTQEGSFNPTVTVSDGKASATASASARARSMTGTWRTLFSGVFPLDYSITQSGTSWSGSATNGNRFTGTLADPGRLTMNHVWIGCPALTRVFSGSIAADQESFDVTAQNCAGSAFPLRFTRQ